MAPVRHTVSSHALHAQPCFPTGAFPSFNLLQIIINLSLMRNNILNKFHLLMPILINSILRI